MVSDGQARLTGGDARWWAPVISAIFWRVGRMLFMPRIQPRISGGSDVSLVRNQCISSAGLQFIALDGWT